MDAIETRTATETDFDCLVDVHRQTFRAYVEQIWGWDEARQRAGLHEDFQSFLYERLGFQVTGDDEYRYFMASNSEGVNTDKRTLDVR